jgi:hypothetical protein
VAINMLFCQDRKTEDVCRVGHTAWKFDLRDICAGTNPALID